MRERERKMPRGVGWKNTRKLATKRGSGGRIRADKHSSIDN
jgi:hypothetical protein